jgi:hypothetical protein
MAVREATPEDIFDILVLTREFMKEGPSYFKFDKDKVEVFLVRLIEEPSMVAFVSEDEAGIHGFIVGCFTDHPFNGVKASVELGWFVTKEKRGGIQAMRLVKAFEAWSKDMGAEWTAMSDVTGIQDLSKLYIRCGYHPAERTFMKEV